MDNSETYIKMCEKAVEIQRNRPPLTEHDYIIVRGRGFPLFENIWLPQQDQLQEMVVKSNTAPLIMLIALFDKFTFQEGYGLNKDNERRVPPINMFPDSMEQLWLAFVMKEKYNKIWTGNEWRNGNE